MDEGDDCPDCAACGFTQPLIYSPSSYFDSGCSCHISPPCNYCMSIVLRCEACGFGEEEP